MIANEIINDIIQSFNSLWKIKYHGKTIEVITPMSTINNSFVSVFISNKDDHYIVSDGGWISNETYDTIAYNPNEKNFEANNRLFEFYLEQYDIRQTIKPRILYYKVTNNAKFIPNLVYDLSNFISIVISSSFISFEDKIERDNKRRFSTEASNYLKSIVSKNKVKTNASVDPENKELNSIKFNAIVHSNTKMIPVSYITGSKDLYFKNAIGVANTQFQTIQDYSIKDFILRNVAIIDDTADGYNKYKNSAFLHTLSKHSNIVEWTNKSEITRAITV